MKKTIALSLATAMALSLAACGAKEAPAPAPAASGAEKTEAVASAEGNDAAETDWPKNNITIIVPFNAGGDTDFHARNLASYLEKSLGVNVVVSNVAGANGSTGMYQVMESEPDGYTALFFHDSMLTNKVVGVAEDSYENLEPVAATIVDNSYVMAVNAKSGMSTLEDVVNKAKEKPGAMLYASSVGGYSYYLGRVFEEAQGIDFNIVDAGGGTDRNAALLAGKIDTNVNPYGVMKSYFDSGDFKAVCTIAEERNPLFPDVPTAKEQGYDWVAVRHYFLSFPKGTDEAIVKKMEQAMDEVCQNPEFIKASEDAYCVTPKFMGRDELIADLDAEAKEFGENAELIQN